MKANNIISLILLIGVLVIQLWIASERISGKDPRSTEKKQEVDNKNLQENCVKTTIGSERWDLCKAFIPDIHGDNSGAKTCFAKSGNNGAIRFQINCDLFEEAW